MISNFLAKLKQILLFKNFSTNKRISLFLGIIICLSLFLRWSYNDKSSLITFKNDITNALLVITIISFFINYFSKSIYALISYLITIPLLYIHFREEINQDFFLGDIFNFFTIGFWIFIISFIINSALLFKLKRQYTTILGIIFVGYIFYFGLYGNITKELSIREDMEIRKKN